MKKPGTAPVAAIKLSAARRPGTKEIAPKDAREYQDRAMTDDEPAAGDYTQLDDSALITSRREVREQLEREPPNMADLMRTHHLLTTEVVRRTVAMRRQTS
jgi:hypothetical protein